MLVISFIRGNFDYCNSFLVGMPKFLTEKLKKNLSNKAAGIIARERDEDSKTVLKELQRLPI